MTLPYGYLKSRFVSAPQLKASHRKREIQYHLHASLDVDGSRWDCAINVGTNDADDLLKYRLVFDFHHTVKETLTAATPGFHDLTGTHALPALDVERGDILAETGDWRLSDVLDGSDLPEPVASLKRLMNRAMQENADVYLFGRTYKGGDLGIHDIHVNQGSRGAFINDGVDDDNDHNDIWQDGALFVDLGDAGWAAYVAAFEQQSFPTDNLGNPGSGS